MVPGRKILHCVCVYKQTEVTQEFSWEKLNISFEIMNAGFDSKNTWVQFFRLLEILVVISLRIGVSVSLHSLNKNE